MTNEARYFRYFTYIKPVTKIPIIKTYGSIIFTLIMIIIFTLFAIKPTVETILVLQKKLEDSKEVLQKVTQKAQNLSLGKENYDNLEALFSSKVQPAIPDSISLSSLVLTLEGAALKQQASISALQIQPQSLEAKDISKTGTIAEIEFTFNIEGNYTNLVSVLQDLQISSRLVSINSLSFNKVTDEGALIMSITGRAYYIK